METMELKDVLGEELYQQVQAKIDEVNAKEADKLKHIRFTDLSEGKYISKEKYDSEIEQLNGLITGKDTEIGNANKLIEELKKASKGDDGMQQKISTYETENARLQRELEETKVSSALKVALLSAKTDDSDYMTFKIKEMLKEKGEELKIDEDGKIKGWDDMLTTLKTQFPTHFESSESGNRQVIENKLERGNPAGGSAEPKNLAEALKQQYEAING